LLGLGCDTKHFISNSNIEGGHRVSNEK